MMTVDPKQFWENKILTWEKGRYDTPKEGAGLLESVANRSSSSLRFRLEITRQLLAPLVAGKRVVEIGCGSGLLAADILDKGAASYRGYDIADAAVAEARRRLNGTKYGEQAQFEVCPVLELPELDADIVFSLGLLDWLTDEELDFLFKVSGHADYLHAISEKRPSIAQWLHRAYVHLSYGNRTGSYVPRYYALTWLEPLIQCHNPAAVNVFRHPKLSFGALVGSLPINS